MRLFYENAQRWWTFRTESRGIAIVLYHPLQLPCSSTCAAWFLGCNLKCGASCCEAGHALTSLWRPNGVGSRELWGQVVGVYYDVSVAQRDGNDSTRNVGQPMLPPGFPCRAWSVLCTYSDIRYILFFHLSWAIEIRGNLLMPKIHVKDENIPRFLQERLADARRGVRNLLATRISLWMGKQEGTTMSNRIMQQQLTREGEGHPAVCSNDEPTQSDTTAAGHSEWMEKSKSRGRFSMFEKWSRIMAI